MRTRATQQTLLCCSCVHRCEDMLPREKKRYGSLWINTREKCPQAKRETVQEQVMNIAMTESDLQHPWANKTDAISLSSNLALTKPKAVYPEVLATFMRMLIPRPADAKPPGQYKGLSGGLPNPCFSKIIREQIMARLLEPMGGSERYTLTTSLRLHTNKVFRIFYLFQKGTGELGLCEYANTAPRLPFPSLLFSLIAMVCVISATRVPQTS